MTALLKVHFLVITSKRYISYFPPARFTPVLYEVSIDFATVAHNFHEYYAHTVISRV